MGTECHSATPMPAAAISVRPVESVSIVPVAASAPAVRRKRHASARNPFMQAGALAPTMGIVGTVFGLVNVMNNLNNPSSLGPLIAAAFLATLMGVGSANVVFLPMANRLKELSEAELHFREMTLEGILAIQAGDNPRVVEEKLMAYVPPKDRAAEGDKGSSPAAEKQAA